jgi:hypothetical protein
MFKPLIFKVTLLWTCSSGVTPHKCNWERSWSATTCHTKKQIDNTNVRLFSHLVFPKRRRTNNLKRRKIFLLEKQLEKIVDFAFLFMGW